ncbi:hypothetical protein ACHAW5_000916 [Stephanodiscus triporus]|uniref:Plastid division protein FtsZ n=1 Tax=Stephanodiscus triporus TaxID=2934178 RepID=A0ABD3MRS0_9STRA
MPSSPRRCRRSSLLTTTVVALLAYSSSLLLASSAAASTTTATTATVALAFSPPGGVLFVARSSSSTTTTRLRLLRRPIRRGGIGIRRSSPPPPSTTTTVILSSMTKAAEDDFSDFDEEEEEDDDLTTTTTTNVPFQTDGGVIMPEGGANPCVIKVLGVGGGGGNAVNRMIQTRIDGVSFWAVNTDAQALAKSLAPNVLNIGRRVTRGLGAGGVPLVGKKSAEENASEIQTICRGSDMIFITAGMGGGTGSGAGPVVAEIARDMGCLTVGVVTKPFAFEGKRRMQQAESAIAELRKHVDTLIVVSNDKLLRIVPENTPVTDAFLVADDILRQGVVGISEIIIKTGLVNVDFADVRAVMKDAGTALMGVGTGVGKNRATDAAVAAISSPLLDFPISEAKRIVFNVVGGTTLGLSEINAASEVIYENAHEDANIIFGALIDPGMGEEVSITVLACDFRETTRENGPSSSSSSSSTVVARVGGGGKEGRTATEVARNGEGGGYRSPNYYKDRREMTRSPLGPDASIEETRTAITRGFKRPEPSFLEEEEEERKSFRKRKGGFFRRLFGSS